LLFNARLFRTLKNYSGFRADKTTCIVTGRRNALKSEQYNRYPDKKLILFNIEAPDTQRVKNSFHIHLVSAEIMQLPSHCFNRLKIECKLKKRCQKIT